MCTRFRAIIAAAGPQSRVVATFVVAAFLMLAGPACDSVTEPTPSCTFTLAPSNTAFSSDGGDGSVAVTASTSSCAWTAVSSAAWTAILQGASGTGSATITYRVSGNPTGDARTATLTVGGQAHAINQQGRPPAACTYTLDPASATFEDEGGTGSFAVSAPENCAWSASSTAAFVQVTAGTGTGSGRVLYSVAENNEPSGRTGTIVVADQTFTITQLHEVLVCDYSVAPVEFTPCMADGTLSTQVTAPRGCTWTATAGVPWLTITSGASGSGSGQVTFTFTSNYDAPRSGVVMVRWPTPTAGQNVRVAQAGCSYGVSQTSFSIAAAGGSGAFDVVQQSDPIVCGGATQDRCVWTAVAEVSWITITTSMPRTGDDRVNFTVAPNGTGATRAGTIRVRDRSIQVTQGG